MVGEVDAHGSTGSRPRAISWAVSNVPADDLTTLNLALAFGKPFALGLAFWRQAFLSVVIGYAIDPDQCNVVVNFCPAHLTCA